MAKRYLYLACYDITDDKRLRRALVAVRRYATGGQQSAHECWLSPAEYDGLVYELTSIIDEAEDRLLLIRLDARQKVSTLGRACSPDDGDWYYIG